MHPSNGTLRRSLDEPVAVDPAGRAHVATCARCSGRLRRMSADTAAVQAMFASRDPAVDLAAARARLARTEVAPPVGAASQRPVRRAGYGTSRTSRVLAGVAIAAAASVALVATGGAQDFLSLFQPSKLAAVPVTAADVRSLAGLASYGTVTGSPSVSFQPEPDAAAAGTAAGLPAPKVGDLPAGTPPLPAYDVVKGGVVTFTFNATLARAAAAAAGGRLPAMPAGLDGSTLSVSIAPAVVVSYGVDPATLLHGGSLPTGTAFIVVATRTPTVSSTGVTARQLENYLLSVPGIPADVASEIRAIGNPDETIPVPIPIDLASASSVTVNGAPGLLIGDSTGLGSALVWQHNGVVDAIAGTLTANEVLGAARSTH
jgi:hypothetical protein